MTKLYAYEGQIALFDFQKTLVIMNFTQKDKYPPFIVLILSHWHLRMPVKPIISAFTGGTRDSLPASACTQSHKVKRSIIIFNFGLF